MITEFNTFPKKIYFVQTAEDCTVLDADGDTLAEISAPGGYFPGIGEPDSATGTVTFSPAVKRVIGPFDFAPVAGGGGGGGSGSGSALSATGEPVHPVSAPELTVQHASWYDNTAQSSISVLPAAWRNEVMTCYLKTAVPVSLSGVIWLYGTPFMSEGYVYVIALQQIDADTVLANLAYSVQR